jgi:hypothetical protein
MSAYKLYVWVCGEFGETPKLTRADFALTAQQKSAYKSYRKECRESGVEPVLANFLLAAQKPLSMAAHA